MTISVYIASKLVHSKRWIELKEDNDWRDVFLTARWPHTHVNGVPDGHISFASLFWQEDQEDIEDADVVLVYGKPGEVLRGALVEAGMGLAYGKDVICVGENEGFGTWQYHPKVLRAATLGEALGMLKMLAARLQSCEA